VAYVFQITVDGAPTVEVQRRYSHFMWLHEQLKSQLGSLHVHLPPRHQLFGGKKPGFLKWRREGLEMYLSQLVLDPRVSKKVGSAEELKCMREFRDPRTENHHMIPKKK
jgi:PX domain